MGDGTRALCLLVSALLMLAAIRPSPPQGPKPSPPAPGNPSHPRVRIVTDFGDIVVELYPDKAPKSVANFLALVKRGFYQNLNFYRVLPGRFIQAGDPTETGDGGVGYTIPPEFSDLSHEEGMVGFGRDPDQTNPERRSHGSRFYITTAPLHVLDGAYTLFGKVIQGMEVVHKIEHLARSLMDRPLDEPKIEIIADEASDEIETLPPQRCGSLSLTFQFDTSSRIFKYGLLWEKKWAETLYSKVTESEGFDADKPYLYFPDSHVDLYCEPLEDETKLDPVAVGMLAEDECCSWLKVLSGTGEQISDAIEIHLTGVPEFRDLNGDGVEEILAWDDQLAPLVDSTIGMTPPLPLVICRKPGPSLEDCTKDFPDFLRAVPTYFSAPPPEPNSTQQDLREDAITIYATYVLLGNSSEAWTKIGPYCPAECVAWIVQHATQIEQLANSPRKLR